MLIERCIGLQTSSHFLYLKVRIDSLRRRHLTASEYNYDIEDKKLDLKLITYCSPVEKLQSAREA